MTLQEHGDQLNTTDQLLRDLEQAKLRMTQRDMKKPMAVQVLKAIQGIAIAVMVMIGMVQTFQNDYRAAVAAALCMMYVKHRD